MIKWIIRIIYIIVTTPVMVIGFLWDITHRSFLVGKVLANDFVQKVL